MKVKSILLLRLENGHHFSPLSAVRPRINPVTYQKNDITGLDMVEGSVNEMSLLCKPPPTMADRQSGTLHTARGVRRSVGGVYDGLDKPVHTRIEI